MSSEPTYALDPARPVLPRPDEAVQIGWAPRRAVIVRPTGAAPATAIRRLLTALTQELTWEQIQNLPCSKLFDNPEALRSLIDELVATGAVIRRVRPPAATTPSIRIIGQGPISDALAQALTHVNVRLHRSTHTVYGKSWCDIDLVVLADDLITEERLLQRLVGASVPHLAVRARDGCGLIGPMVLPGVTSCLECIDRHRQDRDAHWPAVAAQLMHQVGVASPATVMGTVAVALAQIDRVLAAVRGQTPGPLATLNTTLEFDLHTHSLTARRWSAHPLCRCTAYLTAN